MKTPELLTVNSDVAKHSMLTKKPYVFGNFIMELWNERLQECIPVGCVPPAHWPYLIGKTTHAPPEQPRMPPQEQPCMPPQSNHACPPRATTHAPGSNHTCPLPEQPRMPPGSNHACPPRATMHAPPGATMHTPQSNHTCPPPLWTEWQTPLKT